MLIRAEDVKQYKKSEINCKKELKSLKKQNKMLLSISKNSGSRRELKKIKKIRAKASNNCYNSISDSSGEELNSDSSLSRDSN